LNLLSGQLASKHRYPGSGCVLFSESLRIPRCLVD
jgi:hypothetical protein